MASLQISEEFLVNGNTYNYQETLSAEGVVSKEKSVPPAKTGTLSTRTDGDTGTLTMQSGHGITDGDRLDIYWDGGSRRGVTVGTVSGTSVPFDEGDGDDLPAQDTAITAMVPLEEELLVTGDNALALLLASDIFGTIVLAESDDGEVTFQKIGGSSEERQAYLWTPGRNATNPLASADVAKVFFSHGDSVNTATMTALVLVD